MFRILMIGLGVVVVPAGMVAGRLPRKPLGVKRGVLLCSPC